MDLDGGWGERLRHEIARWQDPLPGRVAVFAGLDYDRWPDDPAFGDTEAARLRDGVAAGARGLKVWKLLGLRARDPGGRLVAVDDPRLDPLWAAAGELGVPVTIHVADPIAFFEPLDARNERWEELHEHPDWHFWPTRPAGRPDLEGFPPFDELIDALEAVVVRHPSTVFIGAHVGCAAEDLGRVGTILERAPNFHVDIAARIGELGRQPYTTRAFVERWPDRVLFGTDMAPEPACVRGPLPVPRDPRRIVPLRRRSRRPAEPGPLADPRARPGRRRPACRVPRQRRPAHPVLKPGSASPAGARLSAPLTSRPPFELRAIGGARIGPAASRSIAGHDSGRIVRRSTPEPAVVACRATRRTKGIRPRRSSPSAYGVLTIRASVDTIPADPRTSVAGPRPARGSFVPSRPSDGTSHVPPAPSGVRSA